VVDRHHIYNSSVLLGAVAVPLDKSFALIYSVWFIVSDIIF